MVRDILLIVAILIFIAACFYAFQLVVLLIVGYIIYICLPLVKAGNTHVRNRKWK